MKEIGYRDLVKWREEKIPFALVDVREESEHLARNIGGMLIPLSEIMNRFDEIPGEGRVVFYCKRGIRSQIAIQKLSRKVSAAEYYNLTGGIISIPEQEK